MDTDEAKPAFTLAQHRDGVVTLSREGHRYLLRHSISREVATCDAPGACALHFAPDGYAFILDGDGRTHWAEDYFKVGVFNNAGGVFVEVPGCPHMMPLAEYDALGDLQCRISAVNPPRLHASFTIGWYLRPRGGAHVWWDLSSWYNACKLSAQGQYGRWAQHGWDRRHLCHEAFGP